MKRFMFFFLWAAAATAAPVGLEDGFRCVPDNAKPWVYYWWLNGNVDEHTIRRDLEAMKQAGVGGLLLFDARGYHDDTAHVPAPAPKMEFMSAEWRRLLKYTLVEANRLGLEVSVNLSSCAGALKGPWEVGDDAPKKLVWTATEWKGPATLTNELPRAEGKRYRDIAMVAVRRGGAPESVDLTEKKSLPTGDWTVLRFGWVTMGGHEYDVDILDPQAVEGHFRRMGRAILDDAGPLARKTLTHFYSVSWEGAAPTWTPALEKEFARYRGYPMRPWLPVLAGVTVKSREESERFRRDYFKTLGDCFRDNFYGKMQALCATNGLKWHSESGGPWDRRLESFAEADQLAFLGRNDMPQGEFWFGGAKGGGRFFNRAPAMAAHIYGKPLAASEAFTHMTRHWSAYPAVLKPLADATFCDGVNHLIWHTFTASPAAFGKPGIEYFAGTHLNPNVTWFPQAGAFLAYLGRCQFMLRQGLPVNDVAVYIGDNPYQHWGRGERWSDRATLSLPRGFGYDLITTEVLTDRLTATDGKLTLPEGVTYQMLVVDLDENVIPPAALRRIANLRSAGVPVVLGQRKPARAPGLTGQPSADKEVQRLADTLWAKPSSLEEVMADRGIRPDCDGPVEYTHRRDGKTDIYFLRGSGNLECVFRVADKRPELWDPVTGRTRSADSWRATNDGRTVVPLSLPENGSLFVVFRTFDQPRQTAPPPPPTEITLTGPWTVNFGSKSVVFDTLIPWDQHSDTDIKYFSGAAIYRTTFELTKAQAGQEVCLQLGEVRHLAQVRLNGKDLGIVWTAPWSLELTDAVKPGRNELEIIVVNTWVNRLIGDAALPPEKRTTQTNVKLETGKRTLKAYQSIASDDPLMTSGLLGPVRLEFRQPTSW